MTYTATASLSEHARLHRDVCFGTSNGKIIWQPRIQCWYTDKKRAGEPLPQKYQDMSLDNIFRSLGCSARLYRQFNPCYKRILPTEINTSEKKISDTDTEITIETPVGCQKRILRSAADNPMKINIKWPIASEEEMKVGVWIEENTDWEWDQDCYEKSLADVGDLGAPTIFLPRHTIQDLYINTMGIDNAIFALMDYEDTCQAYFRALTDSQNRLIEKVVNPSPVEIINFGDNVHSGTLPPEYFNKYLLPAYHEHIDMLHSAGKFVCAHWDGDCKPLLPMAKETSLDGIEAITPKPQGDVTLEETKEALGDDMFLLDGIPAVYFDTIFPEQQLIDCTRKIIDMFAPKLILGISDEISSTGDIERVRLVKDIVDEYNAQI